MPLPDGLYSLEIQSPYGIGTGVIVLAGGSLRGGNAQFYYFGTYEQEGSAFSAAVVTGRHSKSRNIPILGKRQIPVKISGITRGSSAKITGTSKYAPGVTLSAVLTKLAD